MPEATPEQIAFARINMRREFNEKFSKWAEIDPVDADDDFIKEASEDLDKEIKANVNKTYLLGSHVDGLALKTVEFLLEWNREFNSWDKAEWRGLIMLNKVLSPIAEEIRKDENKDFEVDYATLIFLHRTMMNPSGVGLHSAEVMAKFENYNIETDAPYEEDIPVTYSGVLSKVIEHINGLSALDKKLNILKQRRDLAYAGLKMNLKISTLEEFVEFNEAITKSHVPEDDEELKETLREAQEN